MCTDPESHGIALGVRRRLELPPGIGHKIQLK